MGTGGPTALLKVVLLWEKALGKGDMWGHCLQRERLLGDSSLLPSEQDRNSHGSAGGGGTEAQGSKGQVRP